MNWVALAVWFFGGVNDGSAWLLRAAIGNGVFALWLRHRIRKEEVCKV